MEIRNISGCHIGLIALLLAVLATGCAMVENDRRALALQASTNGYQAALRWGYYDNAIGYLEPDQPGLDPLGESLNAVRVTGYDVVQPPLIRGDGTATQIVVIDYLFQDTQVVKRLTDRQRWRWDETAGRWWLVSGLPAFTTQGATTQRPFS